MSASSFAKLPTASWTRTLLLFGAFLPLVYTNSFVFPYVTAKAFFFILLVQLALLAAVATYVTKGIHISVGPLFGLFFSHVLWAGVATLASDDAASSMWSSLDRVEGYFFWLHLFAFFSLLVTFYSREDWYRWIKLSFFVSVILALMGLAQYAGFYDLTNNEQRVDILFGNPVFFALYMLIHIGFGALLSLRSRHVFRYFYISAALLEVVTLFYTGTRGAILGLIAGLIVGSLVYGLSLRTNLRVRMLSAVVSAAGICVVGALVFFNDSAVFSSNPYLDRFSVISVTDIKNQSRYYIWEAAIDGIAQRPILGYGYEQFDNVFSRHVDPTFYGKGLSSRPEHWVDRAHNVLLDTAVSTGVPGLLLFVAMLVYAAYVFWTSALLSSGERAVWFAILAAYGTHSMFSFNAVTGLVLLMAVLAYAAIIDTRRKTYTFSAPRGRARPLIVIGTAAAAALLLAVDINRMHFAYSFRSVLNNASESGVAEVFALRQLGDMRYIDAPYAYSEVIYRGQSIVKDEALSEKEFEETDQAIRWAEQQLGENAPVSVKNLFYLGEYYRVREQYNASVRVLEQALEAAPDRQLILIALSKTHAAAGAYEKALMHASHVYELEPTYRDAAIVYAAALLYADNVSEADTVLRNAYGSIYVASDMLLAALVETEQYDRAEYILTESVAHDPGRRSHWELLLRIYTETGDEKTYEETVRTLREHHPDLTVAAWQSRQ